MKKLALVVAFALLAAISVSGSEIPKVAPATTTLDQQAQRTPPLFFEANFKVPPPRCSALDGTSCPTDGATTACTDVCNDALSCTCYSYYTGYPVHPVLVGRYWYCNQEC
jgi:hypothetical protein